MRLIIEATGTIERVNGVDARVWKGRTENGIEIICWIPLVAVSKETDRGEFDRELSEVKAERQLVSFDMRMVI